MKSFSMGFKLIFVCGLALVMATPAFFLDSLVDDRTQRAAEVVKEISAHVGGQQTFLGPTLIIPYTVPSALPVSLQTHGVYWIAPAQASAVMKTTTEDRRRSLFKVPVFQADLKLDAAFDLSGARSALPEAAQLDWSQARIAVGIGDTRGALADATLTVDNKMFALTPYEAPLKMPVILYGANADGIAKPDARFHVTSVLRFSGAQRVAVFAYGKTTHLTAQGNWPSPGFDGAFLPVRRNVSSHGFSAEWSVPFMARGLPGEGAGPTIASFISALDSTVFGVSFVEVADPYQSVTRSLKYMLLFLGLIFLSHFVFEATAGKQVHPAQYLLVGVAQIIFYLLLLSFAERIGFDFGFLIAGAASVLLLSFNAGWIFASRLQAARAFGVFSLLYSMIYMLLRLEDNALLVGAIASFLAVTAAMYFTRSIDWYAQRSATLPQVENA
jgi:inner membrane protein